MLLRPNQQFGTGAIRIRVITLRYPNARFRGEKLFSDASEKPSPDFGEA
jgi:hypothetical protein